MSTTTTTETRQVNGDVPTFNSAFLSVCAPRV